jgi:hypothetical protein
MSKGTKECWLEFCELAAREQDPKKLIALVTEINRLLQEKHKIEPRNDGSDRSLDSKAS